MRLVHGSALAVALVILVAPAIGAPVISAQETARAIAGGGVTAPGWTGKVDPSEEKGGQTLNNAKLAKEGNDLHVTTGPAVTYWNPANKAAGNYTVKATFKEAKYMSLNDHPHPYGIVIPATTWELPSSPSCTARRMAMARSSCVDSARRRFRWAPAVRRRTPPCTKPPALENR